MEEVLHNGAQVRDKAIGELSYPKVGGATEYVEKRSEKLCKLC